MAKLKITDEWWSAPAESENGELIIVTGRRNMEAVMACGKYVNRVEVTWRYGETGMPDLKTSELMEQVTDSLKAVLKKDPVAVLTGIYTGAGERNWVFYTLSTNIFNKKLNEALAPYPLLPLQITAENDPTWAEYDEMRDLSEIPAED